MIAFRRAARALVPLGLLFLAGCGVAVDGQSTPTPLAPGHAVEMFVLKNPDGDVMALVPIYINGQGPFNFALDTGASHSVIDAAVAARLKLPAAGEPVTITGVSSAAQAQPVRVQDWRVGNVPLPARTLVTLDLSAARQHGGGFKGLLGSDILSGFDSVLLDYRRHQLMFHPRVVASGT